MTGVGGTADTTGMRDIPPAGRRFRPGDRILRLAAVGAAGLAFAFVFLAIQSGNDGNLDSTPPSHSSAEVTEVREITGVQADVVLQAIQDRQNDDPPTAPPASVAPVAEAPTLELPDAVVGGPVTIPVEDNAPSAAEIAAQRKANSSLLVYSQREEEVTLNHVVPELTDLGFDSIAETELGRRLVGTAGDAEVATTLTDLDTRILQGTLLSCVLETAISSAVPGMTTCRIRVPAYSESGEYRIIPAGSRVVGEYRGGIEDGQARIFVLWNRLITPDGITVALRSPGAGPLGRGGHGGRVDRKWGDRVAAALMVSLISDSAATASGGEFAATRSAATNAATDVVQSELAVRSELTKNQGERITIIVARDLDFGAAMAQRFERVGRSAEVLVFPE